MGAKYAHAHEMVGGGTTVDSPSVQSQKAPKPLHESTLQTTLSSQPRFVRVGGSCCVPGCEVPMFGTGRHTAMQSERGRRASGRAQRPLSWCIGLLHRLLLAWPTQDCADACIMGMCPAGDDCWWHGWGTVQDVHCPARADQDPPAGVVEEQSGCEPLFARVLPHIKPAAAASDTEGQSNNSCADFCVSSWMRRQVRPSPWASLARWPSCGRQRALQACSGTSAQQA